MLEQDSVDSLLEVARYGSEGDHAVIVGAVDYEVEDVREDGVVEPGRHVEVE
jgi:hypothetical protein